MWDEDDGAENTRKVSSMTYGGMGRARGIKDRKEVKRRMSREPGKKKKIGRDVGKEERTRTSKRDFTKTDTFRLVS